MHIGFIFSIPVVEDLYIMAVAFVWHDAYLLAILLSRKASLNSKVRWSAVKKAILCWTKKFVIITSAFKPCLSRFKSLLVKKLVIDDCFFEDLALALCDSFLQWSVTFFSPWWSQDSFLQQGIQKKLIRVIWNTSNRVKLHPCLIKLALIKFTLCCRYHVSSIWKVKAHAAVSLTLILRR